jgi:hypothetical protein
VSITLQLYKFAYHFIIDLPQRVTRPKGGINEWLHWLPVSLHKKIYYIVRTVRGYSLLLLKSPEKKLLPSQNGAGAGLLGVLEADAKQIVNLAQETYEK